MNIFEQSMMVRSNSSFIVDVVENGLSIVIDPTDKLSVGDIERINKIITYYANSKNNTSIVYGFLNDYIEINYHFDYYFNFTARVYLHNNDDANIIIYNKSLSDFSRTYYKMPVTRNAVDMILNTHPGNAIVTLLEEYAKTNMQPYDLSFLESRIYR